MTELLTAAQMRAIEQAAIASGEVTGLELMERAGRGVVEAIFEEWPEMARAPGKAVVLCGPGNNGGDGFVVARLLKGQDWDVEVFLYGDEAKLPPDAAENCRRWRELGEITQIRDDNQISLRAYDSEHVDLFIDAFFGTGLRRPVEGDMREEFLGVLSGQMAGAETWPVAPKHRIVAVDMPSGLCSDSGRVISTSRFPMFAKADLTVTFHNAKRGHYLAWGSQACGVLRVVDLGIRDRLTRSHRHYLELRSKNHALGLAVRLVAASKDQNWRPSPLRKSIALRQYPQERMHKYRHGHALILSGGVGKGGAARLVARGALRIGAGLVTVGCPPEAIAENAARLDAVMVREVARAGSLASLLEGRRINALCVGPGIGVGILARTTVLAGVAATTPKSYLDRGGCVVDADALTSFKGDPETLFAALHENCVLTPHGGEFARLFPDIAAKLAEPATRGPAYSKVDATRDAAARAGCVVLYKGADTVIAGPSGRCAINSAHYDRAAPWLATAGSGDVLAGFITGLMARGFAPMHAAETAAWLHVECALSFGPGLIAEDLPEELPKVFRKLGL